LGAITVIGLVWGGNASLDVEVPMQAAGFGLAMVFVLYAYGGWNDAAFVAAEVRNRPRNMPLALLLGTGGITLVYLLVNLGYLWGLGFENLRTSSAPAADVAQLALGDWGGKAISVLVMLCALGAINGLIFTGSRIYFGLGSDHRIFAWLGRWNAQRHTPIRSLLVQTFFALLLIAAVGTTVGQSLVDASLEAVGLSRLPWEEYFGGFETLVAATAPVFWGFFLLTGFSLFILRAKDYDIRRPFSAPLYPLEPILFCGMCYFMLFSAIEYAGGLSLLGLVPVAAGLPLYWISQISSRNDPKARSSAEDAQHPPDDTDA
jgi:amino acid transporter